MATALDTRLQAKTVSPTLTVDNLEQSVAFSKDWVSGSKSDGKRTGPFWA